METAEADERWEALTGREAVRLEAFIGDKEGRMKSC